MNKNTNELMPEAIRSRSRDALNAAIKIIGTRQKLSTQLRVTPGLVTNWLYTTKYGVSAPYVIAIEKLTNGAVKRYNLRCDIYPDGDHYFSFLRKLAKSILNEYEIKVPNEFNKIENLPTLLNTTIYESRIFLVFNPSYILITTNHPEAYKYGIFQEEYKTIINLTKENYAFFSAQLDIVDQVYLILKDGL